jgi:monoamine oxidase
VRLSDEQRSKLSADYKKLVKQEAYRQQSQLGDKTPDQSVGATMERTIQELQRAGTIDQNQAHSLRHFIVAGIESSYAADAEDLSLRYWDKGHWFDGDDMLVEGGYKKIIDILAEGLDIRLSHSVKEIRYKEGPAKIYTEDGGQFSADQVVVTLPLGVLKNRGIKFAPDLPSQKVEAIDRLGVGLFNKIYLGFDEAFWPKDPIWFEHMGTAHDAWPWFFNIHRFSEKPILMAFNVGSYARQLEGRSDEAITEEAMGILHRVAKKNGWKSRRPIATQVTRWGGDPFARGSYSYIPVGASLNDLDLVGAPVGKKLFFAGEATSSQDYMTAHAAYLSGLRVAKALVSSKN